MAEVVLSGGPIAGRKVTFRPAAAWTDPAPGDLVIITTGANYEVTECADTNLPSGIVRAVDKSLTILTVELFTAGSIQRLLYDGSPTLGDQVHADRTKGAGYVEPDASGVGHVVGIDVVAGYVDVIF